MKCANGSRLLELLDGLDEFVLSEGFLEEDADAEFGLGDNAADEQAMKGWLFSKEFYDKVFAGNIGQADVGNDDIDEFAAVGPNGNGAFAGGRLPNIPGAGVNQKGGELGEESHIIVNEQDASAIR